MDQKELMAALTAAAETPVSHVDLSASTQRIMVDMDTRKITGHKEFGVIKDHLAENIIFEVKRYKGDTDLAEKHCAIHWENGKNGGVLPVTEIDLSEDGHILMRWELSDEFTQYKGQIAYALHFFSILDGGFTYHAATNAASGTLGDTLNASAHSLNKITPSEIEVYIAKMNELSAAMDEQVVLAQEAATKAESIAEQLAEKIAKVEELTQKTEINKNDISKLSGELDILNQGGLNLKDEVIAENINNWLDEHPEATTTVQDESLDIFKFKKNALPFITLSQLGAEENTDISDILMYGINNYKNTIIVIDKNYTCEKDITINVGGWHIYSLPGVMISTSHTLYISNCSQIQIDNLVWRDLTANSENVGLVLESTVSLAIFNNCTFRGFKSACIINDVAYVVFNDCNFIAGRNSETLVKLNNYFSELSKFNRCNFEGGMTETQNCTTGIEIEAGVWFEFNSCDITSCETLLKMNDLAANTRQLRFTNCTFNHYVYAVVYGDRGLTSLLFAQCIFKGHDGKYTPLYLLKDVKGNVTFRDCYEMTEADNYCYINVAENKNTVIIGNFLEAKKFYSATTENVKDNIYVIVCIELTNPDTVSISKNTTTDYKQINSIGFFKPKLLWSDNKNAYKVIPYCEKPADTTCRIYFGITKDENAYTYAYQLCRLW